MFGSQIGVCPVLLTPPSVAMAVSSEPQSNIILHEGVEVPLALVTHAKELLDNIGRKYGSQKWRRIMTRHKDTPLSC